MKNILFFLSVILLFTACQGSMQQQEIENLRAEIATLKSKSPTASNNTHGQMVHAVYFDLKNGLTKEEKATIIEKLQSLSSIEGVRDFQVGSFADVGDKRALSDYEMAILMEFEDEAAYRAYQQHPTHLDVKKLLGAYLAGAPVSYDFWI